MDTLRYKVPLWRKLKRRLRKHYEAPSRGA